MGALIARGRRRALLAVQGLGQDPRQGGLARPTHTGKEVGVVDAIFFDGIAERNGHVLLTNNLLECFGTVFAGKDLIGHVFRLSSFVFRRY
jgi:hypothetical protein